MPVRFVQANRMVRQCAGRLAVQRGPVVYCAEGVDNPLPLRALFVDPTAPAKVTKDESLGVTAIELDGYIQPESDELYFEYSDSFTQQKIKLIPYYAYANRGETDMLIWLTKK